MAATYNFNLNPAFSAQFSTISTSSADTSGTLPLSDGSTMTVRGLLVPGNRREAANSSAPNTNYKKFSPCANQNFPPEEQQNLLNWSASSHKSTKSSSIVSSFCCSSRMGRRVNCCIGTLLAVCTLFLLIIGSCVLAAGIIILLQLYVSNEPFGLGVKLSHREDGGSELVWILKLVGWFVTVFGILLVIIGFSGCTGSFGRVKRDYKVLGKVFLFIFLLLVLIVFVTTLGFTILTIVFQESIQLKLKSELSKSMNYYKGERSTHPSSIFWNFLQLKMECCGTEKAEDWSYNKNWAGTRQHSNQSWPYVCCKWQGRDAVSLKQLDTSGVPRPRYAEWEKCYRYHKPEAEFVFTKGCARAVTESVEKHSSKIYLSLACFLATLTMAIIFAAILCRHQNFMFEFSMDPLDM